MTKFFADFDVKQFWKPSEYALKEYVGATLTDEVVAAVEARTRLQTTSVIRRVDATPERRHPPTD